MTQKGSDGLLRPSCRFCCTFTIHLAVTGQKKGQKNVQNPTGGIVEPGGFGIKWLDGRAAASTKSRNRKTAQRRRSENVMHAYSVTYDVKTYELPDYKGLEDELKASPRWWHFLKSTWLILTSESGNQLASRLLPHIHKNDRLLVIEVFDNKGGWLTQEAWDWINAYVPSSVPTP